jgi:hypothetical protein
MQQITNFNSPLSTTIVRSSGLLQTLESNPKKENSHSTPVNHVSIKLMKFDQLLSVGRYPLITDSTRADGVGHWKYPVGLRPTPQRRNSNTGHYQ